MLIKLPLPSQSLIPMETKLLVFVIVFVAAEVSALKCYNCVSKSPNITCFTPINVTSIPLQNCSKLSVNISQFIDTQHVSPIYIQEAMNATEYQCVFYTRKYMNNITQVGRGCLPKTHSVNACQALQYAGGAGSFNLTECNVCDHDNCNSSASTFQSYGIWCAILAMIYILQK